MGAVLGGLGLYRRRMAATASDRFEKVNQAYQQLAKLHAENAEIEHRKRLDAEAQLEKLKYENPDR